MPRTRPPYPEAFRRQIAQLALSGRSKIDLSREFGCAEQSVTNWVAEELKRQGQQPASKGGIGPKKDGLSHQEREELNRLRRAFTTS